MAVRAFKVPPRLVMLSAFGGTSVLNYAFGLIMGWLLLPGDFGWLAFAQTILLISGLMLQSGFSWSLARAVANAEGGRRDALVRGTLLANCSFAVALGAVVVASFALGPLRVGLETWTVTALVALSFPFISLAAVARGCAQGSERFGIVASLQVTEIFCKVVSGIALVLLGFGVVGAICGFLIGAFLAAALGVYHLLVRLRVRLWDSSHGGMELPTLRVAGPMFGALLGLSLLLNLDLIALKLLSEERALTGYYQAGLVLANAPYYLVMSALVPVLFVQLARLTEVPATARALGDTLSLTLVLVAPMEFVLVLIPERALLVLLPDAYAVGAEALRILAVGNLLLILVAIFSATFQAIGRARVAALVLLVTAALEPFALWAVVPRGGAVGAASVFALASAIALLCLAATYAREAGAERLRSCTSWLYRYVAAAGVGVACGTGALLLGGGSIFAVVVGGVCYLFAVVLLRLIRFPRLLEKRLPFLSPAVPKK